MRPITLYPEYRIEDLFDAPIYVCPSHEWGRVPSFHDPEAPSKEPPGEESRARSDVHRQGYGAEGGPLQR